MTKHLSDCNLITFSQTHENLSRNGSTSKKNPANSRRLRILCQCFCYVITAVVCFIMVGAIFWLHIQMKVQAHDFQQQLNKGNVKIKSIYFFQIYIQMEC